MKSKGRPKGLDNSAGRLSAPAADRAAQSPRRHGGARAAVATGPPGQTLGWHGITAVVPTDWSFAAFSGDWVSGYFRAESPSGTTLEVKWSEEKGSPSLQRVLKDYTKRLQKEGRRRQEIELHEKPRALSGLRRAGGAPLTFSWRTERQAYGAVWHCAECRRVMLCQVSGPLSEDVGPLAARILPTVTDHPEGGMALWSVYDFTFEVPDGLHLEKSKLMSGYLALEFTSKGERLAVERWGLANVILKREPVSGWLAGALFKRLKPYKFGREEVEIDGHEGVRLAGRRQGARDVAKRVALWLIRRRSADWMDALGWHCPDSNRVFAVVAQGRRAEVEELAETVAGSVRCHPDT